MCSLFKSPHSEHIDFFLGEEAPVATLDILLGESGEIDAVEFDNMVAEALKDTAHDAVLATVDFNAYLLLVGLAGIFYGIGVDVTVFEGDAFHNLAHIGGSDILIEGDVVDFLLEESGVGEFRGQFAVIGEEKNTGGVAVEATYGIDAFGASAGYKVHDGLAFLGIVSGGDIAFGLVEEHILFLLHLNGFTVEAYFISAEHFGAEFGDGDTIDGHYAGLDVGVGIAA
mgnify:CR=1 FL=1